MLWLMVTHRGRSSPQQARFQLTFSSPAEVTGLQSHGSPFQVSTHASHLVHALGAELGHRRLASQFELSLLAVRLALTTGFPALVARVTRDTYTETTNKYKNVAIPVTA